MFYGRRRSGGLTWEDQVIVGNFSSGWQSYSAMSVVVAGGLLLCRLPRRQHCYRFNIALLNSQIKRR
jgi:hypothetical protein